MSSRYPSKRPPEKCFYCNAITTRYEFDHFPRPDRYGGETTVVACLTCHDFKDRIPMTEWPTEIASEILAEWHLVPPRTRLLLGVAFGIIADYLIDSERVAA